METHVCAPRWLTTEIDDDANINGDFSPDPSILSVVPVYGADAKAAALQAMEVRSYWYDHPPVRIVVVKTLDVAVTVWPEGKYKVFNVTVEPVPYFSATQVTPQ